MLQPDIGKITIKQLNSLVNSSDLAVLVIGMAYFHIIEDRRMK